MNCAEQRPARSAADVAIASVENRQTDATGLQYPIVGAFRAQHLVLSQRQIVIDLGRVSVVVDEIESPLGWLARRRGRDGRPLIEVHQLQSGERLRADFTRAQLMPRTTSNWSNPLSSARHGGGTERADTMTETIVAARQRVHQALDAVGPEFSGLLVDVCCFLKASRISNASELGRRVPARSCCNSRWTGWPVITVTRLKRAGRSTRKSEHGSPMTWLLAWKMADYATAAKAVFASARIRSTMERNPFERCGVRFSRRPIRSKSRKCIGCQNVLRALA